jgi:outer membrane protein OmpA-like peptidoglycan-associated protein
MFKTMICLAVLVVGAGLMAGCCMDPRPQADTVGGTPPPVNIENPYLPLEATRPAVAEDFEVARLPLPTPATGTIRRPAPVEAPVALPGPVVASLRDLAAQNPGLLSFDEATGRLRLVSDLTFDSGSNVVKPEARAVLAKLAAILAADVAKHVNSNIIGHTDSDRVVKPSTVALLKGLKKSADNQGLSEARAEAVAAILAAGSVDAKRLTTGGAGDAQPVADNKTTAGKAQNRRVEVWLTEAK